MEIEDARSKLIALIEGLEIQDIIKFLHIAKVGDYRNLGAQHYKHAISTIPTSKKRSN